CISYSNSLYSPLVLDDSSSFIEDPAINIPDFSIQSLEQLARIRFGLARLIPIITLAIDHHLSGGSIVQFHITNIIIHVLTTIALYFFLRAIFTTQAGKKEIRFIEPPIYCLFIVAMWALHPIQTNCVTYLVQRMASLATLFYLASLAFYIRARLSRNVVKAILLFIACLSSAALGFMSKETVYTLPAAILFVELTFISPDLPGKILRVSKWRQWSFLLMVILILLPLGENYWHFIIDGYTVRHFTLLERILTELRVVVFYISLLILPLPSRMNLDHDFSLSHSLFSPPTTLLCLFILVALLWFAIWSRKRNPFITFGIFWFFLNLVIESTVIPLELVFEHRLYLPSIGFFIVVVALVDMACEYFTPNDPLKLRKIILLAIIIVACFLSTLTTMRNHVWRDALFIYRDCVEKSPQKSRPWVNYGLTLGKRGLYDEAMAALEKGIAVGRKRYENTITAAHGIVFLHLERGEIKEAKNRGEKYLNSFTIDFDGSGFPKLTFGLARAYHIKGQIAEAFGTFARGFVQDPAATYLLTALEIMLNDANNSTAEIRKPINLSGEPVAVPLKIALLLLEIREYEKCRFYLEKALQLDSNHKESLEIKKILLARIEERANSLQLSDIRHDKDFKENRKFGFHMSLAGFILNRYSPLKFIAGRLIEKARQIRPENPFVPVYLASWHVKMGRVEEAVRIIEEAIPDHSDFPPLLELAGSCYLKTGKPVKAGIVYQHLLDLYHGHPQWKSLEMVIKRAEQAQPKS
ncbi:MAG: hypothetical protein KAR13_05070, partial [Desulfobulbaceae bacterium]|nr:hypothetical protein [Desulfobulbaceae bacterium]